MHKIEPLQVPGVQAQCDTVLSQSFPSSNAFDPLLFSRTAQGTESPLSPTEEWGSISWLWHTSLKRYSTATQATACYWAEANAALASHLWSLEEQEKETGVGEKNLNVYTGAMPMLLSKLGEWSAQRFRRALSWPVQTTIVPQQLSALNKGVSTIWAQGRSKAGLVTAQHCHLVTAW